MIPGLRRGSHDDARLRPGGLVAFTVPLLLVVAAHGWVGVSHVGSTMTVLLVGKLLLARLGRSKLATRAPLPLPDVTVGAIMAVHNEDPALAAGAVRSLVTQTRPLDRIHVIDDGSTDCGAAVDAVEAVLRAQAVCADWEVTRLSTNVGKRAAMSVGFTSSDVDIFLCIDSDTQLDDDAVDQGLRPFADTEVAAVTGLVMALNWRRNLLTRLIELRYVSAFLAERAAYSYFGAVLCCCGSLSFYRAGVVRSNLADFASQRFLGRTVTFGDDRRLTNYALRAGKVVLAERARAQTAVPERLGHYVRQQVRWNKSFVRESAWVLGTFPLGHNAFWLTLVEVVGWIILGALTLIAMLLLPLVAEPQALVLAVGVTAAAAYARSASYLERVRPDLSARDRLGVFALAPLYAVIHLSLLLPIRCWALMTLRRAGWGTRQSVEVRLAHGAS